MKLLWAPPNPAIEIRTSMPAVATKDSDDRFATVPQESSLQPRLVAAHGVPAPLQTAMTVSKIVAGWHVVT